MTNDELIECVRMAWLTEGTRDGVVWRRKINAEMRRRARERREEREKVREAA